MPGITAGTAVAVIVMGPSLLLAAASSKLPPSLVLSALPLGPRPALLPRPGATGGGPSCPRPRPPPARSAAGGAIAAAGSGDEHEHMISMKVEASVCKHLQSMSQCLGQAHPLSWPLGWREQKARCRPSPPSSPLWHPPRWLLVLMAGHHTSPTSCTAAEGCKPCYVAAEAVTPALAGEPGRLSQ